MKKLLKYFVSALFPKRCAYCGKVIAADELMCSVCAADLPRIEGTVCPKCGRGKELCSCRGAEMYFSRLAAPFYFKGVVRKGIHSFKFRRSPENAEAYAVEMASTVKDAYGGTAFDFIAEVPMTAAGEKERGYNQVRLLAERLGSLLGIEHKRGLMIKLYETQKQHGLSRFLRKGNLTGVFDVSEPSVVEGKTILLCDDISTSGETLNECAKMLWLYGAREIFCITVALTVSENGRKDIHK